MAFTDYTKLMDFFTSLGVTRAFMKELSENDNAKQQIYLGGSFEALNKIPYGSVRIGNLEGKQNFKAPLDLFWVSDDAETAPAPHAQLILYPKYPEVRLSGFLRECAIAPSTHLQPIPKSRRKGKDGRLLIFGVTSRNRIYIFLAPNNSPVANSLKKDGFLDEDKHELFVALPMVFHTNTKEILLAKLSGIIRSGWRQSCKLDTKGGIKVYKARNGGGYTLEALLGVIPNGVSEPDILGWEIKAFSRDRITLMTPEPDKGFYGEYGVKEFVRKYGHDAGDDTLYFTGSYKVNTKYDKLELKISGFNSSKRIISNPGGGIYLQTATGDIAAMWSFEKLLEKWGRKHAQAAYIKYLISSEPGIPEYYYQSPVWMGEGTDFILFLSALEEGNIIYDPASKIMNANSSKSKVKARSQFRIPFKKVNALYRDFNAYPII